MVRRAVDGSAPLQSAWIPTGNAYIMQQGQKMRPNVPRTLVERKPPSPERLEQLSTPRSPLPPARSPPTFSPPTAPLARSLLSPDEGGATEPPRTLYISKWVESPSGQYKLPPPKEIDRVKYVNKEDQAIAAIRAPEPLAALASGLG